MSIEEGREALKRASKRSYPLSDGSPDRERVAKEFFDHKKKNPKPTPFAELTPLQKRMQSGDA
jgi:hypothetical protein